MCVRTLTEMSQIQNYFVHLFFHWSHCWEVGWADGKSWPIVRSCLEMQSSSLGRCSHTIWVGPPADRGRWRYGGWGHWLFSRRLVRYRPWTWFSNRCWLILLGFCTCWGVRCFRIFVLVWCCVIIRRRWFNFWYFFLIWPVIWFWGGRLVRRGCRFRWTSRESMWICWWLVSFLAGYSFFASKFFCLWWFFFWTYRAWICAWVTLRAIWVRVGFFFIVSGWWYGKGVSFC
jgi:hypothetical protein